MKWTNKYGLPEPLAAAITNDSYSKGPADFSVTELVSPPQVRILTKRFDEQITEDVSDHAFTLFGRAVHSILEAAGDLEDWIKEHRKYMEIDGKKISGATDSYQKSSKSVEDYKVTTVYSFMKGKIEWEQQTNMYAAMWRNVLYPVEKITIQCILRDWMRSDSLIEKDYPPMPFPRLMIPVWKQEEVLDFMRVRVKLHSDAESAPNEELPECTVKETWAKPESWAIKTKDSEKARKVIWLPGEVGNKTACEFADEFTKKAKDGREYFVEHRPGEPVRCLYYCKAAPFCHQFAQYKQVAWKSKPKEQVTDPA